MIAETSWQFAHGPSASIVASCVLVCRIGICIMTKAKVYVEIYVVDFFSSPFEKLPRFDDRYFRVIVSSKKKYIEMMRFLISDFYIESRESSITASLELIHYKKRNFPRKKNYILP